MTDIYEQISHLILAYEIAMDVYRRLLDDHREMFPLDVESAVLGEIENAFHARLTQDDAYNLLIFAATACEDHPELKLDQAGNVSEG